MQVIRNEAWRYLGTFLLLAANVLTAQSPAPTVAWDEMRAVGAQLQQDIRNGAGRTAHARILEMEMILGGSSDAAKKVAGQIVEMEKRPVPIDKNLRFDQFEPTVVDALKAIGEADPIATYKYLEILVHSLGDALFKRPVQRSSNQVRIDFDVRMDLQHALSVNDTTRAVQFAAELQEMLRAMTAKHAYISDDGLDHYMIYDALGRAAFKAGDYKLAADNLQEAAEIPANTRETASLDNSGPNLWLAEQLLHVGKRDEVLLFLQTCIQRFWLHDASDRADKWIAEMLSGKSPDMSSNSGTDYGYALN